MKLYILLATYNGESYIQEQIESILNQTFTDWHLIIRDDGSSDSTVDKINYFIKKEPRIELLEDSDGNLGVVANFSKLAEKALIKNADYIMFSDQDDIWDPNKIKLTLDKIQKAEAKYGVEMPILVHTDLRVINKDYKLLSNSFLKYQHLKNTAKHPIKVLLTHNFITGSTILLNNALLKVATPFHDKAIMHDWWYGLAAAIFGRIEFLPAATISYRQHGKNIEGSSGFYSKFFLSDLFHLSMFKLINSIEQACKISLLANNSQQHYESLQRVRYYCQTGNTTNSVRKRFLMFLKSGARPQGFIRILIYNLTIIYFILSRIGKYSRS